MITSSPTVEKLLDTLDVELGAEIEPIVQRIEAKLPTTQHHYGDYMAVLASLTSGHNDKPMLQLVGLLMVRHGANANGVLWALKHIGAM